MMSDMNYLLNLHGKFFGTFWACETCAEIGWSPQFNSRNEIEIHINKIHIKSKTKKLHIDNKISNIIEAIKEYDEQFLSLIDSNFDESFNKIKYFIGSEENLDNLDDSAFKYLIRQIETFYSEKEDYESLINYNYLIEYNTDILKGNNVAFITEAYSVNENVSIYCDIEKVELDILETENKNINTEPSIDNNNFKSDLTEDLNNSIKVEYEAGENVFCDVKSPCEDKQLNTHKVTDLVNKSDDKQTKAPKIIFSNKDDCESDDNIDNSEVIAVNIGDVKNNTIEITEDFIKMENNFDSKNNKPDENMTKYDDFFNSLLNKTTIDMSKDRIKTSVNITNETWIYCDKCSYKCTKTAQIKWHMQTYHEVILFSSEQCNFNSSLKHNLIDHIQEEEKCEVNEKINSNIIIKCEEFGDNFVPDKNNTDEKDNINKLIMNDDPISIEYGDVQKNRITHGHNEGIIDIECDDPLILLETKIKKEIDKIEYYDEINLFENPHSIQEDILIMEKNKLPFNDCDKLFNSQILLNIHIKSNHKFNQEFTRPKYIETCNICDKCVKNFYGAHDLYRHKTNLHEQVQYSCEVCEYKSQQKEYLKMLMKIHIQMNKEDYPGKYEKKERSIKIKLSKEWKKRRKKKRRKFLGGI